MSESSANLMVAVFDRVVCIKVNGRADFTSSVDLKKLITELWQRGYNRFVLELRDCTMMDSTFLGMLAGIGLKFCNGKTPQGPPLELYNPNPRIAEVLENLGVNHLFKIHASEEQVAEHFQPLAKSPTTTKVEVARTCLESHRILMDLSPENADKFKDVAHFFAEDLKRLETEKAATG
jgi:anti-sigma B factor antagonist